MTKTTQLTVSLICHNTKDLVKNCLENLSEISKTINLTVLLIDNASKDETSKMVRKKFPWVKLFESKKNLLFTKAHNINLKKAKTPYFLVLNEDTYIPTKTLKTLINFLQKNPKIGLVSSSQKDENNITDNTCSKFPDPFVEIFENSFLGRIIRKTFKLKLVEKMITKYRYLNWKRNTIKEVDVIPGSFMLGKKEVLDKIGYFDENLWLFYEEPDYCYRAKNAGFKTYHYGKASIIHLKTRAIAKLPAFWRYQISQHDVLAYYKKYFGLFWFVVLWFIFLPNWFYWRLISIPLFQNMVLKQKNNSFPPPA